MTMIVNVMKAEWMKTRHTALPWLALIGGLFMPLVQGLIYVFRWKAFIPEAGNDGWESLLSTCFGLSVGLLFPFLVILLVAFNQNIEFKANAWKRLLVTPLGRPALFVGKWLYLMCLLLVTVLVLLTGIVLVGLLLGWVRPSLVLSLSMVPFGTLLHFVLRMYISFLAILTLQYVLSYLFNNTLIPVMVGVLAYILSMVLVQGWSYAVYDPYAFPLMLDWELATKSPQFHWLGLYKTEWLSLLYSLVIAWLGGCFFKRSSMR